ncbi:MAG TPA: MgtC/SapB family protein [Phycisphaerales bacterium]|nr:MgtC/SapB family protein [Phycisphaerales bacterium]
MEMLSAGEVAVRVGAALVLGGVVGLERERKSRPAGFRTMILISMGSAAFMVVAHEIIAQSGPATLPGGVTIGPAEVSRVLQGLIGGIGFLGAGAVIQNKRAVRGLTTAAAVWVTAAIGAACGLGLYVVAGIVAGFTLFTLVVLEWVENRYFPEPRDDAFAPKGSKRKADDGAGVERLRGEDEPKDTQR